MMSIPEQRDGNVASKRLVTNIPRDEHVMSTGCACDESMMSTLEHCAGHVANERLAASGSHDEHTMST